MALPRIIPILLVRTGGLYKTTRFSDPTYVGDPINAVRIFNDKECDELVLLDIEATVGGRPIDFERIEDIAGEAFMPMCYGGGVRSLEDFARLFALGIEKVAVNTAAIEDPALVESAADCFGSQSIVVAIDVKRSRLGRSRVWARAATADTGLDPVEHAKEAEERGAGEILLTAVDREGTGRGYELDLVRDVAGAVGIPVIANGGAATLQDIAEVLRETPAAAAAAGSLFVFQGRRRAVLISYPGPHDRAILAP